jgi:ABC-type antimicrobial peptide transport system permease subunit
MMGASRYDLIAVTLCQNLMLGLMGLGIGYIIGYSTLILYFSVHGVPLEVFANPYFVLTSMLSFVLGLLFMAAAASGSAIMVSFESPARLINTH